MARTDPRTRGIRKSKLRISVDADTLAALDATGPDRSTAVRTAARLLPSPTAIARICATAEAAGCSPATLIEEWAAGLRVDPHP